MSASRRLARRAGAVLLGALLWGCAADGGSKVRDVWLPASEAQWEAAAARGITLYREDKSTVRIVPAGIVAALVAAKQRLQRAGGASAELALVDSDRPNAFAFEFAGRRIVAFSLPWLDKLGNDPDAVAAALGHELAHVHLGHSAAERREREKSAEEAGQVTGVLLSIVGIPLGGTIAGTAASAYARSFSREEERAADELGLKWVVAAGYDACGIQRVIGLYEALDRVSPHPWLSAHPGHAERAEFASRIARESGGKACR